MTADKYIKTFNICGKDVKLGMDDYGQCFFCEWEEGGEVKDMCLGTYCFDYMESMYSMFDPVYHELDRKELFGEVLTTAERKQLDEYKELFKKEYTE